MSPQKTKVAIACQGGGSHTAFTAGALIEILSKYPKLEKNFHIIGFSGTSGGGICAALAWYGLNFANYNKSIEALEAFWEENKTRNIYQFCLPLFSFSPFIYNTTFINKTIINTMRNIEANSIRFEYIPAWLQSESRKALETILEKMINKKFINFDDIKGCQNRKDISSLYIGAVNINDGTFKAFKNEKITLKVLLASTAVPPWFESVEVVEYDEKEKEKDREFYWDGLYSQNPPISNFLDLIKSKNGKSLENCNNDDLKEMKKEMKKNKGHKPDEIWIIRINPKEKGINEIRTPQQQKDRQNELAGNLSLQQELNSIKMVNKIITLFGNEIGDYYKSVNIREITIDETYLKNKYDIELDYPSKLERTPFFIDSLIEHGKEQANQFLDLLGQVYD